MNKKLLIITISAGAALFAAIQFLGEEPETDFVHEEPSAKAKTAVKKKEKPVLPPVHRKKVSEDKSKSEKPDSSIAEKFENDPEFEVPVVEMNKEERVAALHDLQMQAASAKIRQKHFALFKKLNLSEADREAFVKLLAEKDKINGMHPRGLSEEDRKAFNSQKEALLANVDKEIQEFLGDDFDLYENIQEFNKEYNQLARHEDELQKAGEFNEATEAQLAEYMKTSYHDFNAFHRGWERYISISDENAEKFLDKMTALNQQVVENAPVNDEQKEVLHKIYSNQYKYVENMAKEFSKIRKSTGQDKLNYKKILNRPDLP